MRSVFLSVPINTYATVTDEITAVSVSTSTPSGNTILRFPVLEATMTLQLSHTNITYQQAATSGIHGFPLSVSQMIPIRPKLKRPARSSSLR